MGVPGCFLLQINYRIRDVAFSKEISPPNSTVTHIMNAIMIHMDRRVISTRYISQCRFQGTLKAFNMTPVLRSRYEFPPGTFQYYLVAC